MRIDLVRVARRPAWPFWAVGICLLWAGMITVIHAADRTRETGTPTCLLRHATGVPCPTCGGTRAVIALAGGDPVGALMFNPLIAAMIPVTLALGVLRVGAGRRIVVHPDARGRAVLWLLVAAAVIGNWTYVVHQTLAVD